MKKRRVAISEICYELGLSYEGTDKMIDGLNLCNRTSIHKNILSYVTDVSYLKNVKRNPSVTALVIDEKTLKHVEGLDNLTFIKCNNSEEVFYDIHEFLYREGFYERFDFESEIGDAEIGRGAVVERGVRIGDGVKIGANTVIRSGTVIEDDCSVGCNCTLGSEGFQVLRINGKNRKIPHVGMALIKKNVDIGDNTCICNSLFEGSTYIGEGVKIDNLVYVGHNLYIGKNAVVTAHVTLCGSAVIEEDAWIAPNVSVLNRVTVGKGAKVGLGAVVTRDVVPYTTVYGCPAKIHG